MKGVAKKLKFTIAEAAKKLGVTTKGLYAAIKDGRLKANQEEITVSALNLLTVLRDMASVSAWAGEEYWQ